MNRLTEKVKNTDDYIKLPTKDKQEFINKLGKIEDLMEKYEINSIEQLEEILKENNARFIKKCERWFVLLETDGIDSKNMVATDIQKLLEEIKK